MNKALTMPMRCTGDGMDLYNGRSRQPSENNKHAVMEPI